MVRRRVSPPPWLTKKILDKVPLTPTERDVVMLYWFNPTGWVTMRQIAEMLGISYQRVSKLLLRAAEEIEKYEPKKDHNV